MNTMLSTHERSRATGNGTSSTASVSAQLRDAFIGMAGEITRPRQVRWHFEDAARGRSVRPLGAYPQIAEECADAGASYFNVSRPLSVMLAHLRRRYRKLSGADFKEALCTMKREADEAEAAGLTLAFSVSNPSATALVGFEREATEAIQALEVAKELAADRLCEMQEAR